MSRSSGAVATVLQRYLGQRPRLILTPELARERLDRLEAAHGGRDRLLLALERKYPGLRRNVDPRD